MPAPQRTTTSSVYTAHDDVIVIRKVCTRRWHKVKTEKSALGPSSCRELKLHDKSTSPESEGIDFQQHTFGVSVS